ncbi:Flagellar biosynthesis protein FlhB [hydrothermal vent metagenome]|uniref:Flagellar biosynthesis protein FlhB n=1 Tax=hydrothermal vent metagenome TaxID=652676 RepID=A0A3B0XUP1_9ZZZZ
MNSNKDNNKNNDNNNHTKPIAIALQYDGKNAPRVTATGSDTVAIMIQHLAQLHDIPCQFEPVLAELLSSIDEGEEIPEDLYRAVAEVIAFAYWLSGKVCSLNDKPD